MRLLNTTTFKLHEFFDIDRPKFAILSHTWEKDEVSYQEMMAPTAATKIKDGFLKIQAFARIAESHLWHWVWVDTCCIDKDSSAELSEAINSMYRWYGEAAVCYVYLSDFRTEYPELLPSCRWFTRGWTLQELIAPRNVRFYSHLWEFAFTKSDMLLELYSITGIDPRVLQGEEPSIASIARRMSWASKRQTRRAEDMAYCLLGLFDINMPMLYGEGSNAFVRLQTEILKCPHDQSLFAWVDTNAGQPSCTYRGLLARHPRDFQHTRTLHKDSSLLDTIRPSSTKVSVSNLGLRVHFPLFTVPWASDPGTFVAVLRCISSSGGESRLINIGILLKRITQFPGPEMFVRVEPHRLWDIADIFDRDRFEPSSQQNAKFYIPLNTISNVHIPRNHVTNRLAGFFVTEYLDPPWQLVGCDVSDSTMEWDATQNAWMAHTTHNQSISPTHMALQYRLPSDSIHDLMVVISWRRHVREYRCDIIPIVPSETTMSEYLKTYEPERGHLEAKNSTLQGLGRKYFIKVHATTRMLADKVAVVVQVEAG